MRFLRTTDITDEGLLLNGGAFLPEEAVKIGYEINFNRHFYKPQPMRPLEEIRADILALEQETEGLLGEIVGTGVGA